MSELLEWSASGRALAGEPESGDGYLLEQRGAQALVAVIDGLGHGTAAAEATARAVDSLKVDAFRPVDELLRACHAALRGTRGAVMSLAALDGVTSAMTWAGVGNVEGVLLRPGGAREALLLRGGVVGDLMTPPRLARVPLVAGDLLVLTTDGIRQGFSAAVKLFAPVEETARALRDGWARPQDDALAVVVRWLGLKA